MGQRTERIRLPPRRTTSWSSNLNVFFEELVRRHVDLPVLFPFHVCLKGARPFGLLAVLSAHLVLVRRYSWGVLVLEGLSTFR